VSVPEDANAARITGRSTSIVMSKGSAEAACSFGHTSADGCEPANKVRAHHPPDVRAGRGKRQTVRHAGDAVGPTPIIDRADIKQVMQLQDAGAVVGLPRNMRSVTDHAHAPRGLDSDENVRVDSHWRCAREAIAHIGHIRGDPREISSHPVLRAARELPEHEARKAPEISPS
jgi:hypothetical protein